VVAGLSNKSTGVREVSLADAREIPATGPNSQPHMSARALYDYVWRTSRSQQAIICILTIIISPIPMAYLELQRRIVDDAIPQRDVRLLALLGIAYLLVICVKSALKYGLNMAKGVVVEIVARDLRRRVMRRAASEGSDSPHLPNRATLVSMLSAETEDMSGFSGDAFAVPLLSIGTIGYVAGYLLWVQPAIAILALFVYLPQILIVPATQHSINRLARLRIRLTRFLGHLAVRLPTKVAAQSAGGVQIQRLYRVRIWIYQRKFFLSELGNFLANVGPLIVLTLGGYLVITGQTEVGTLVVFISGLQRISDPWDELVNFYRAISNTIVMYAMICDQLGVEAAHLRQTPPPKH
jgi:ABC-type multidrug transport system fused ATPase/permease subunit